MGRAKHVQTELVWRTHGGRRKRAGRPPTGARSNGRHTKRPSHQPSHPVHVTMRIASGVQTLRSTRMYPAVREATLCAARREDFRIVHMSIQRNHVHLIVEADSKTALSKGIWGFEISAAKHINAAVGARTGKRRKGAVFAGRYHRTTLTTPRAVRNTIAYVLNNWRHHREDQSPYTKQWLVDRYASAIYFDGWKERENELWCWRRRRGTSR